jgi:hypothetical protein
MCFLYVVLKVLLVPCISDGNLCVLLVNVVVIEYAWLFNCYAVGGFVWSVYFCMLCIWMKDNLGFVVCGCCCCCCCCCC